jgi:5'-nucleotidase
MISSLVHVQIGAINDFSGYLEPPHGSSGRVGPVEAGGAVFLAAHLKALRARHANTVIVSCGDLVGASPMLSGSFRDEPTIEVMNEIGLDLCSLGSHEFDHGVDKLLRLRDGDGTTNFAGARFEFVAANVRTVAGQYLFRPYVIKDFEGARVAFIGIVEAITPTKTSPANVEGLVFLDEADTLNALVPGLRRHGVAAVVALIHQGGRPSTADINGCAGLHGQIIQTVERLNRGVDLVISGGTSHAYNCVTNGVPVTSAMSRGRVVTAIDLKIDPARRRVMRVRARNLVVTRDTADPPTNAILSGYRERLGTIADQPIGRLAEDIPRDRMGYVVADAALAATAGSPSAGAELALIQTGSVRADLLRSGRGSGPAGTVTLGQAFAVLPFRNPLVTVRLTGEQLLRVLEEQFCGVNAPANGGFFRVLRPSAGTSFSWARSAAGGPTCDGAAAISNVIISGSPLDVGATYSVTVNSHLAGGGDGFATLREGIARVVGVTDLEALVAYLGSDPAGVRCPAADRVRELASPGDIGSPTAPRRALRRCAGRPKAEGGRRD